MNYRVRLMELFRRGALMSVYKRLISKQYQGDIFEIEQEMNNNAIHIFKYHVENNYKYREFLDSKGFDYSDLNNISIKDIPFITKSDLKLFNPVVESKVYNYTASGGSTNAPFLYPASVESTLFMWPCHWLVHSIFGVRPYEKLLMLMGRGFYKEGLKTKFYLYLSNFYSFNSFELSSDKMLEIYNTINKNKIKVLYGYSSSINQFLRFLQEKDLYLNILGIVGTSDNMIKDSYLLARKYCGCDIYDQYGAHDGDVFAFECECHDGLHIIHDFCTVEVVNREIVLTAVKNYAFPFIRYKVGDLSEGEDLIKEKCKCGRTLFRLKGISGRSVYYLKDKDGNDISLIWITFPLDEDTSILQYQIYKKKGALYLNFITESCSLFELENRYKDFIFDKLGYYIEFVLNGQLYKLPNGKLPLYIDYDKYYE